MTDEPEPPKPTREELARELDEEEARDFAEFKRELDEDEQKQSVPPDEGGDE